MASALVALGLLGLLGLACTLTGRLHVGICGPRWLLRFGPIEAIFSALLGAASWMVLLTALSAGGLEAPTASLVLLGGHAMALGVVVAGPRRACLRPRGPLRNWVALLLPTALAGVVGLLPVLRFASYATANDSLLYCSMAQWLQDHAQPEWQPWRPDEPVAYYPAFHFQVGLPFSPAFLLAGVQALARATSPVPLFPIVSALGLSLAHGGLLTFGRVALRWPRRWLCIAGAGLALLPQPLVWSHHGGFFAQTFGLALLLGLVLLLERLLSPRRWRAPEAGVLGLLGACLASAYPSFLALLAGAAGVWSWRALRGSKRPLRLLAFLFLAAALAAVLVIVQGASVTRSLEFLRAIKVGAHVALSPLGFLKLSLGSWFWTPQALDPWAERLRAAHSWLTPLYLGLGVLGLGKMARSPRAGGILACLAVLLAGIAWYSLVSRDPWTGDRGHTWNLLKLSVWAYPFLGMAEIHGLVSLGQTRLRRFAPFLVLVPLALVPVQWSLADQLAGGLESFVGSRSPLQEWSRLRQRFLGLRGGTLLVADRPSDTTPFLPTYLGLLAYPRRLVGDWSGSLWVPSDPARAFERPWNALARGEGRADGRAILPVVTGLRGRVTDAVEPLGERIGLVKEPTSPRLLAILDPADSWPGPGGCTWIGRARTRMLLFTPRAMKGVVALIASPGPAVRSRPQHLVVVSGGVEQEVWSSRYPDVELPIQAPRGVSRVEIRFPEAAAMPGDPRRLCVADVRVIPAVERAPVPAK